LRNSIYPDAQRSDKLEDKVCYLLLRELYETSTNSVTSTKGCWNGTFLSPEGQWLVGSKEGKISLLLTPLQLIF
jgi:hypothetical protein